MRTALTLKNTYWGIISQFIILLIGFVSRKIFLVTLDPTYLGLSSLLTNVISLISLAELGISSAIIYHLYKPIANGDKLKITQLMNLYKDAYRIIALTVFIIGVSFIPFLNTIVKDQSFSTEYIQLIFCLYLFDAVISYFYSYKRSIIFADQKNYIVVINDTVFRVLTGITNIVVLLITHDFVFYLLSTIILKFLNNLVISKIADSKYPYINGKDKIGKEDRRNIFVNIRDIFVNKISWTVTSATDNIIMSVFFNLSTIGLVSNYSLVISSLQSFVSKILDSTQAGIGDLLVRESNTHIYIVLKRLNLLAFLISSSCSIGLAITINPLISIWIGDQYLIEYGPILVLILNFFFIVLRSPLWQMMAVSGLFRQERNIAIIGTVSNLLISLILVEIIGLIGIFLGTLISIIIQIILKIPLFLNNFLSISSIDYFKDLVKFIGLFIFEFFIVYSIASMIFIENKFLELICLILLCLSIPTLINYLFFKNTKEYKYFTELFKKMFLKKI